MRDKKDIQSLADGRENISLRKDFSVEELNTDKDSIYNNMQEIRKINKQKAELQKQIKELAKTNENLFDKVGKGFTDEETNAYYIDTETEREYYTNNGEFIKSRSLRPAERENSNIFKIKGA